MCKCNRYTCSHGCSYPSCCSSAASCSSSPNIPYKGGPLDLTSHHGSSLFRDRYAALDSKFTGKVDALHVFLVYLKTHTKTCQWDSPTHEILSITVNGNNHHLLEDYRKLSEAQCLLVYHLKFLLIFLQMILGDIMPFRKLISNIPNPQIQVQLLCIAFPLWVLPDKYYQYLLPITQDCWIYLGI